MADNGGRRNDTRAPLLSPRRRRRRVDRNRSRSRVTITVRGPTVLRRRRIYPLTIYDSIRFDPRHSSHSRKLLPLPYPPISFEIALRFIARPSLTASSAFLSIFFFFFSFLSFFLSRINSIRSISSLRRICICVNGGDRESLDGSFINRAARNYFRLITRASWRSRTDRATRACSVEPRKLGGIS